MRFEALLPSLAITLASFAVPVAARTVESEQRLACVGTLTFANDAQRREFLDRNAEHIVAHSFQRTAYYTSDVAAPVLRIATEDASCPVQGLAPALGLDGGPPGTHELVSTDATRRRHEAHVAGYMRGTTESTRHQCVVRMQQIHWDDPGGAGVSLTFSGMRSVWIEGADDVVYVLADEPVNCSRALWRWR